MAAASQEASRVICTSYRLLCAAVILSLALDWLKRKKRRNLYQLPSYTLRLLALPYLCRTATQKPTLVYAIDASGYISPEISCRKQDNYISTGIYRCSILDFNKKFCENFKVSRISADKRFLTMSIHPTAHDPNQGFCDMVDDCKINNCFSFIQILKQLFQNKNTIIELSACCARIFVND